MIQKFILDTNIVNSLVDNDKYAVAIRSRIAAEPVGSIFLCTVTAVELIRGVLGQMQADESRKIAGQQHLYLAELIKTPAVYEYLPFDDAANAVFLAFSAAVRRAGAADCKIVAVAQVNSAVVVTRNAKHFASIIGTRHEDWTRAVTA